jgi:4-oxalomesaconate tautomerase
MEVFLDLTSDGSIKGAGTIRTARKLFGGRTFPS